MSDPPAFDDAQIIYLDEHYGGASSCVEIKILRRVGWRCRFLTARPSQDGRVIAEK